MTFFLARRLLYLIPVLIGITLLAFLLGILAPGDPAMAYYTLVNGVPPPNDTVLELLREEMGLNDPIVLRYGRWVLNALRGDLGRSYHNGFPVLTGLANRFPATLKLALCAMVVAVFLAFPTGILAAVYHNSIVDLMTRILSLVGACMPSFWLAYILILLFSVRLDWFPASGAGTLRHLVLPSFALGISGAASLSRLLRSSLLEILGTDYIRAARSKGVRWRKVILVHALRNALIPVVTLMGGLFGNLTAGAIIVETVFAVPGLGQLLISGIGARDYPLIQGFVLFTGTLFVLVNLMVDLSYAWIDPRVQLSGRGR